MTLRICGVAAVSVCLAGCMGIAHVQVSVPELKLDFPSAEREMTLDLICANFYGESESFAALVSGSLSRSNYGYDRMRVRIGSESTQTTCRMESRYIGFPAIAFAPTAPSSETARSRILFLHVEGGQVVYRVMINGKSAHVEVASLGEARDRLPIKLSGPEPPPLDAERKRNPHWAEYLEIRGDYYRSIRWTPSQSIRLTGIETSAEGAILRVAIDVQCANLALEGNCAKNRAAPSDPHW